jgi:hypothetical protein
MGTGKSFEVYGICQHYSTDTEQFTKFLSEALQADFRITIWDKNYNSIACDNMRSCFNQPNKYHLLIYLDEDLIDDEICSNPRYELSIPLSDHALDHQYVEISFNANKSIEIIGFELDSMWGGFIQNLKFESPYDDRPEEMQRYQATRHSYIPIFKSLGIDKLLICTHDYTKLEALGDFDEFNNWHFDAIVKFAQDEVNKQVFDLLEIINTTNKQALAEDFLNTDMMKIAFIDHLNQPQ